MPPDGERVQLRGALRHICLEPDFIRRFPETDGKPVQVRGEERLTWAINATVSSGPIEGLNSLIQAAIAKARGYRNPRNLISIACLIAGKPDFTPIPARIPSPT